MIFGCLWCYPSYTTLCHAHQLFQNLKTDKAIEDEVRTHHNQQITSMGYGGLAHHHSSQFGGQVQLHLIDEEEEREYCDQHDIMGRNSKPFFFKKKSPLNELKDVCEATRSDDRHHKIIYSHTDKTTHAPSVGSSVVIVTCGESSEHILFKRADWPLNDRCVCVCTCDGWCIRIFIVCATCMHAIDDA